MRYAFCATTRVTAMTLVACLAASSAIAGVADWPLPVLEAGKKTLYLYTVPGVLEAGYAGTFFSCTSTDTATMRVSVEGFPTLGGGPETDAVASSLSVGAGETVVFSTQTAAGIPVNSVIGFTSSRGSARILATSRKLACTAFVADRINAVPTFGWQLTMIKKTKQKGD